MRILLLGEFSGLHKNIKEGLAFIGHDVTIASSEDGWKKIPGDINFGSRKWGIFGKIEKLYKIVTSVKRFKNYDIVQCVSPVIFPKFLGINKLIFTYIFNNNAKVFLVSSGDTPHVTATADFLKNDYKHSQLYYEIKKSYSPIWGQTTSGRKYNKWFFNRINGVIPEMYEYAEGFRQINYNKLCQTIPLPMNISKVIYTPNAIGKKVVFFHGLNNEGVKGTPLIRKALDMLKEKYPNEVEIVFKGYLPLNEYLDLLKDVNVVVDQVYYTSYGLNALYSLALGRIVVGGGGRACLDEFKLKKSPIFPLEPSVEDIFYKLESVLKNKDRFTEYGAQSRRFVEDNHNYIDIAKKYIKTWEGC
jgi:glycosyltransferase involved in cell wall biosynthesis